MKLLDLVCAAPVREDTSEHLLLSMLRKIQPYVKELRVYYQLRPGIENRKVLMGLEFHNEVSRDVVDMKVLQNTGQVWVATIPNSMLDEFTIKTAPGWDGKQTWILIKKNAVDPKEFK